nr:disease resistance protein RPP13-like isoform X6 [Ipomoea batatas]
MGRFTLKKAVESWIGVDGGSGEGEGKSPRGDIILKPPRERRTAKKIQDEQRDYGNYDMVVIEENTLDVSEYEKSLSEEEPKVDN